MNSTLEPTAPAGFDAPRPNPTMSQRIWNLAAAVATFVGDGCHLVTNDEYQERLAICDPCPERRDNICSACGCQLLLKAQGRALLCPLGKWPVLTGDATRSDLPPPAVGP